jgi:glycosyltransferase involved in cell wall biosynthesis
MVMHFFKRSIYSETNFVFATYVYLSEKLVSVFYKKEKFIAISQSTRDEIKNFGIDGRNISIVEPGIDISNLYKSKEKDNPPLVAFIGRLMKYKNAQFIIRALPELRKKVPGVLFVAAGSGDYLPELKKIAQECNVEKAVIFAGRISEEEKRDLLSKASLFVNPSEKEGWGINNIEANLCGTISLSSNVAGLRDSVQDGVTGLLYEPGNIDDFCDKAASVLLNQNKREQLEKNALIRAKTFEWELIADRMESVLNQFFEQL